MAGPILLRSPGTAPSPSVRPAVRRGRSLQGWATAPARRERLTTQPSRAEAATRSQYGTKQLDLVTFDPGAPMVFGGRAPARFMAGETIRFETKATWLDPRPLQVFVRYRETGPKQGPWKELPMRERDDAAPGNYVAELKLDRGGKYEYALEARPDEYGAVLRSLRLNHQAGKADLVRHDLDAAALLLEQAAQRAEPGSKDHTALVKAAAKVRAGKRDAIPAAQKMVELAGKYPNRKLANFLLPPMAPDVPPRAWAEVGPTDPPPYVQRVPLYVEENPLAARGFWYEVFPRNHGGFKGVTKLLPYMQEMGVDVLYFPPLSPIGKTNRLGRDKAPLQEGDPGSPWAIGNEEGGHGAIDPALGTEKDFIRFVKAAQRRNIEPAIDLVLQASPDHPWVTQDPSNPRYHWFERYPDGTLKPATNPPKVYPDVTQFSFYDANGQPRMDLWEAIRDEAVMPWLQRGVRVIRIDNPHTKAKAFWSWLHDEIRGLHPEARVEQRFPDVVTQGESFTDPNKQAGLSTSGISHMVSPFAWRRHLTGGPGNEGVIEEFSLHPDTGPWDGKAGRIMRPFRWVATPDILERDLQFASPARFRHRAALAAMGSPLWGFHSGIELFENVPRPLDRPLPPGVKRVAPEARDNFLRELFGEDNLEGWESRFAHEQGNNDKYFPQKRDLLGAAASGPDASMAPFVGLLNRIRKANPALLEDKNFVPLEVRDAFGSPHQNVAFFMKKSSDGKNRVLVAVSLSDEMHQIQFPVPYEQLGLDPSRPVHLTEHTTGKRVRWNGPHIAPGVGTELTPEMPFKVWSVDTV